MRFESASLKARRRMLQSYFTNIEKIVLSHLRGFYENRDK